MSENYLNALAECRSRVDEVDLQIVDLLNKRTTIVEEIGRIKKEADLAIYEPGREARVYAQITAHNQGPLSADGLKRIFERIMDEMRRIQKERMEKTERMGKEQGTQS